MVLASLVNSAIPICRRGLGVICAGILLMAPLQGLDLNGTSYLNLTEVGAKLGMKPSVLESGKVLELRSEWTTLRFEVNQREMAVNKLRVHLGFPIAGTRGNLYMSESDFRHTLEPILTPQVFGQAPRIRHIVIDAGHGGTDPGAENPELRLREKALTLDLAARLKVRLEQAGYTVSLTRSKDEFIALTERTQQANSLNADLFLSLHFNASADDRVSGVETYAYTPPFQPSSSRAELHSSDKENYPGNTDGPWSTLLGFYVQRSLQEALATPDRGLKRARFTVLQGLEMPGLLIEGGFLTNSHEGRNIGSALYREKIASAVVDGLAVFQSTAARLKQSAQ
jgi:N-acetylmuramoyl-L-alanine amidase